MIKWIKLNIAPGTADKGLKCAVASDTASPEFCIPTSIEMARLSGRLSLNNFANKYPIVKPLTLCNKTTPNIIRPVSMICDLLPATTLARISEIDTTEIIGKISIDFSATGLKNL